MYNVNPVADEKNFRIRGEAPGVEKRRHYKVYLEEYDQDTLSVDRI